MAISLPMDSGQVKKHLKALPGVSYVPLDPCWNHFRTSSKMREYAGIRINSKSALQVEALAIFSICVRSHVTDNHICMEIKWVPREQNQQADYYSRLVCCILCYYV